MAASLLLDHPLSYSLASCSDPPTPGRGAGEADSEREAFFTEGGEPSSLSITDAEFPDVGSTRSCYRFHFFLPSPFTVSPTGD